MTTNAPEADPAEPPPPASGDAAPFPRPSFLKAIGSGAKIGVRSFSFVAAPFGTLWLVFGLVPTAFGLGAGRGFGLHRMAVAGAALPFAAVLLGALVGAAAGLIGFLIDRARGPSRSEAWQSIADRPIRLFPWRRARAAPGDLPRPRRRRWPWLVGVPALLILATAFGVGIYAGRFVDRRLAAALAAADRDDPGWRFDDLMAARVMPPDEDNSAIVVADVVAMMPEGWPSDAPAQPGGPKPTPSEAARAFERLARLESNVRMDDETADAVRAELADHADAVELARTVADYEGGEHELELTPNPIDIRLPETQGARLAARLLAADAAIRAHEGDLDGALDSCRAILGVGRSIGDEPMLDSKLVRVAIAETAMASALRVLAQGEPSDAALAALQADLAAESPRALLILGMRGERAILDEVIRKVRDGEAGELPLAALSGRWPPVGPVPAIATWGTLIFDNQRAVGLEWMAELVAIVRLPPFERPPLLKAWEAELLRVKATRFWYVTAGLPLLMTPAATAAEKALTRCQARLEASVIVCAAERHRRKTGAWPESIAAIDPGFLAEPPVDPFSGGAFRIERDGGRFLVHSVGPNLKDEHGAYEGRRWLDGGPDDVGMWAWDPSLRGRAPAE